MDPDNYVNIAVIANFPRMRHLTKDIALVTEVMSRIPTLEVCTFLVCPDIQLDAEKTRVRPVNMPIGKEIRIKLEYAYGSPEVSI
jgi:hypothetical protein